MKNIFIAGVARSGKSTIAKKVCEKLKYNHLPLDYFTASLKRNFPDMGVKSNVVISKETSSKLALLLSTVFNIIDDTDEKFIIDSAHIMPEDVMQYLNRDKWEVYYVGYPNITKKEKISMLKKWDKPTDWTYTKTDEEIDCRIENLIKISSEIEKQCKKLDIHFIDTSIDFIKTIEKESEYIISKVQ